MALRLSDWQDAILAEVQVQALPIWAPIASVQRNDSETVTLRYHAERARRGQDSGRQVRIGEDLARARIQRSGRQAAEDPGWRGTVVEVLDDDQELLVRLDSGSRQPQPGEAFQLFPHNFLQDLLRWLRDTSAELPATFDAWLAQRGRGSAGSSPRPSSGLRQRQQESFQLLQRPQALLWGPPGTGKTHTLAAMAAALVAAGKRVVLLAPTRVAADQATLAIDQAFAAAGLPRPRGAILRTDLPELYPAFEARGSHLLAWAEADHEHRQAASARYRQQRELRQRRNACDATARAAIDAQLGELQAQVEAARERYKALQQELVAKAKVVCATIRQNQSQLWHATADQVFVDEASMVSVSDGLHLLWTGTAPTLFAGDHKQLGPIAQSAGRGREVEASSSGSSAAVQWLGTSVLEFLDRDRAEFGVERVMLNEQSRMNAELCAVVSREMYEGELRAVSAPEAGIPPRLPGGICVLDSSEPPSWLSAGQVALGRSPEWWTTTGESAQAAVALARWLAGHGYTVVLAAPYRAQAGLLRRGVGDLGERVRAGTVHRLQGQEADVSIYDPTKPASWWADRSREAPLLLNVAASRARRAFVICNGLVFLQQSTVLRGYLRAGRMMR